MGIGNCKQLFDTYREEAEGDPSLSVDLLRKFFNALLATEEIDPSVLLLITNPQNGGKHRFVKDA